MKKFDDAPKCDRCGHDMLIDNDELIDNMTSEPSNLVRWKCPKCHCEKVIFKQHKKCALCRIIESLSWKQQS